MEPTTMLPIGPAVLGLRLGVDATISSDGWLVRDLLTPLGLDGPPGILQGGFAAGITADIARAADRFGAPLTAIDARLHAPTPLGVTLQARVRATDAAATYEVETRDGDQLLVSATVELAGHDPSPRAFDLLELATGPLPEPEPQHAFPTCWVCGPEPVHPHGQRLHPRFRGHDVVVPFIGEDELTDARGMVDGLVVSAILDCPTVWASMHHVRGRGDMGALLAGYHLRMFADAPPMEPLRTVARMDDADGRKIRARSALVDEDGVTYAVASAFQISVGGVPSA
jgi:hypothetical protein